MPKKKTPQGKENLNQAEDRKKGDQEIARLAKMEKLAQEKIELFPHKVKVTHTVFEVTEGFSSASKENLEKKKVRVVLAGRVMSIRGMGRATFFHITDSRSRIQAYLREDKVGKKKYKLFSLIVIGIFSLLKELCLKPRLES
jgi:lysyl-tRNA synthetase class 2